MILCYHHAVFKTQTCDKIKEKISVTREWKSEFLQRKDKGFFFFLDLNISGRFAKI